MIAHAAPIPRSSTITLYDANELTVFTSVNTSEVSDPRSLEFSEDGRRLLICGLRTCVLWDVESNSLVSKWACPANDTLLSAKFVHRETRAILRTQHAFYIWHTHVAQTAVVSPRPLLGTPDVSRDGVQYALPLRAIDPGTGRESCRISILDMRFPAEPRQFPPLADDFNTSRSNTARFTPDGRQLLTTASYQHANHPDQTTGRTLLWNLDDGSCAQELYVDAAHTPLQASNICFSEDGDQVLLSEVVGYTSHVYVFSSGARFVRDAVYDAGQASEIAALCAEYISGNFEDHFQPE